MHRTGNGKLARAWNPKSKELQLPNTTLGKNEPGFLKHIENQFLQDSIRYYGKYKYLLVMIGSDGLASADRLPTLLAHSGAVVLLQESEFSYHFSARLKAWVHYVRTNLFCQFLPFSLSVANFCRLLGTH